MENTNLELKPVIGITMGDPAGVGPEITVKALSQKQLYTRCRPLVVGDADVLALAQRVTGQEALKINRIRSVPEAKFEHGVIDILDMEMIRADQLEIGKVSSMAGNAAFTYEIGRAHV